MHTKTTMTAARTRLAVRAGRLAAVGTAAAAGVLFLAGPASAHVSVQPGTAEKGGYSTISIKVPNEKDNASTVKVELALDPQHPLVSVMPQAVPGWDVKVEKTKLDKPVRMHGKSIDEAVSKVVWTGGKIEPGNFQQFPLSVGQLPTDADQLVFKALQTYSDDDVVRWIDPSKPGGEEPEHPAPVLKLVDKPAAGKPADDGKNNQGTATAAVTSGGDGDSTDTTARVLGVVGIVVGVAGAAFGVLAGRRRPAA
ncbi:MULTISPECIES: YcnI family copper-binding membrane protein [Streptomyces]|uniref:YcnI family copper-binding membrane protein n=1 Tax=Streptomyces TaxID=1883 RepID=UPI00163B7B1C|nr:MULTISPECIES: YcnI family protein [Streptomyces]MBC2873809.1 YcnI family protein [Streptomyces sp. TYQ1024]UBI37769.1 YcnI family protein [Streptomyces mobaraensis]UKW30357.1 YcnI family protein [Streptomyces sp. TYQ1024]